MSAVSRATETGSQDPAEGLAARLAPVPAGGTRAPGAAADSSVDPSSRLLSPNVLARPAVAVSLSVTGVVLLALVGAGAPNNHTLDARLGPAWLGTMPGIYSTVLTYTALVLSSLGLAGMLAARSRGWRPSPRRLFGAGAAAVMVVTNLTPVGSSDIASYAAYGRIAALGGDPYVMSPAQLGDTYAHLVGSSWKYTPSVYGPVATWVQEAAALVGGARAGTTIWLLMLANGAVFLATGYLLMRIADDPVRAGLMWVANPLLIALLVSGGHLDTIVTALAVCAAAVQCATLRSGRPHHDVLVGVLAGLACGVKISAVLVGAALVWLLIRRRRWWAAARLAAAGVLTLLVLYSWYGPHAISPLSAASHMVSAPSLWAVLQPLAEPALGHRQAAAVTAVMWPVMMLGLAWWLHRRVPADAPSSYAMPFALTFAWVLVAPWSMPWYTAIAWAMAAQFLRGPLLRWQVLTTTALAVTHFGGGHGWRW
jgi:hypothetical protein